ncbi:leucyl aminopeptidase [Candidatus Uhrbacteria bacterium]|nr:leucyl aminopeptidase [Candidatus Uhrbacteria bacterium]
MKILFDGFAAHERTADLAIWPVFKGAGWKRIPDDTLLFVSSAEHFEGGFGEWVVLPTLNRFKARKFAVMGMGEKSAFDADAMRRLGANIIKRAKETKAKTLRISFSLSSFGELSVREAGQALAEGMILAGYGFHSYHAKNAEKAKNQSVVSVTIAELSASDQIKFSRGCADAEAVCSGVLIARDLVNTPSMDMFPLAMAEAATRVADRSKRISIKILDRSRMERMKMQAALSVARGSEHEPVGVHMVYKPAGKAKKRIVIVGKAVTFDSGGLSIKPADGMMTMKMDMAGGASVIGLFRALADIDVDAEVHGIFLAVENMPSGNAYRPGDVVRAMNGTTIEILNTDAEGRVVLADALCYAQTLEPDAIIDLATLTGACIVALGEDIAGLMTNDRKLADRILAAADESGEPIWELPMYTPYEEHVKSRIADIKNIGARGQAGTIAGAMFLKHFVGSTPWVHLDIAGPAYTERESRPDLPAGATGFGVRTLVRYLQGL